MKVINREFRRLVPKLREKDFYKSQENRKINWSEYNLAQTCEAPELMSKIKELVNLDALIPTASVGRPLTNPNDLVKAILVV